VAAIAAATWLIAVQAQADDVVRLKHGEYVLAEVSCQDAPFAAIVSYDGKGFGDPHSHDCHSHLTGRDGSGMKVETNCVNSGQGAAPRIISSETIRLGSFTAFDVTSKAQTSSFRWCATTAPAPEKSH
jgi:hypothetical protein